MWFQIRSEGLISSKETVVLGALISCRVKDVGAKSSKTIYGMYSANRSVITADNSVNTFYKAHGHKILVYRLELHNLLLQLQGSSVKSRNN